MMQPVVGRELLDILTGYLLKEKSLEDFDKWWVGLLLKEGQEILGLEPMALDVPESDFWEEAMLIVAGLLRLTEEVDG